MLGAFICTSHEYLCLNNSLWFCDIFPARGYACIVCYLQYACFLFFWCFCYLCYLIFTFFFFLIFSVSVGCTLCEISYEDVYSTNKAVRQRDRLYTIEQHSKKEQE